MKNIKIIVLLLIFSFFSKNSLKSEASLVFYLNHAPKEVLDLATQDWLEEKGIKRIEKLEDKTPAQVTRKLLKQELKSHIKPKLSGFPILYNGYIDYSNHDGLVSFPLRHTTQKLYLVITPQVNPLKIKGNTISCEKLVDKEPANIYLYEKKEDQAKVKNYYWQVTESAKPSNNVLNPLSVIILANPKNIYVQTGDFLSDDSKNIVLPKNIYVINSADNVDIILNTLDIKYLYEPTEKEEKTTDKITQKILLNN